LRCILNAPLTRGGFSGASGGSKSETLLARSSPLIFYYVFLIYLYLFFFVIVNFIYIYNCIYNLHFGGCLVFLKSYLLLLNTLVMPTPLAWNWRRVPVS